MIKKLSTLAAISLAALLSACDPQFSSATTGGVDGSTAPTVSGDSVEDVAKAALVAIQPRSIRNNKEYCGLILRRADGTVFATQPVVGGPDWCQIPFAEEFASYQPGDETVADYHTHAGYDPNSDSEVPSVADLEGNGSEGIPGYVATPGGRFWFVAANGRSTYQICGVDCLPDDPDFQPETGVWVVEERYSIRELRRRQS